MKGLSLFVAAAAYLSSSPLVAHEVPASSDSLAGRMIEAFANGYAETALCEWAALWSGGREEAEAHPNGVIEQRFRLGEEGNFSYGYVLQECSTGQEVRVNVVDSGIGSDGFEVFRDQTNEWNLFYVQFFLKTALEDGQLIELLDTSGVDWRGEISDRETCGCAMHFPELRGDKEPYERLKAER